MSVLREIERREHNEDTIDEDLKLKDVKYDPVNPHLKNCKESGLNYFSRIGGSKTESNVHKYILTSGYCNCSCIHGIVPRNLIHEASLFPQFAVTSVSVLVAHSFTFELHEIDPITVSRLKGS